MILINTKKLIKCFIILFFCINQTFAVENKILLKIDNEIITSFDIFNEIEYLSILNPQFKNLENKQILEIAKNSLVREKIKKIEVKKKFSEIKINNEYLNKIVQASFSQLNIENFNDLKNILQKSNIDPDTIKQKISIEVMWNQLIYDKFNSKIKINIDQIKKNLETQQKEIVSYLLSEIVFIVDNETTLINKTDIINKSIFDIGFKNTALKYSISESSKFGGNLGWIEEGLLNSKIRDEILNYEIGDHTKPILNSGSFLILKIEDKKKIKKEINIETEMNRVITSSTNQQLSQFSSIYFNKVKKDMTINEL